MRVAVTSMRKVLLQPERAGLSHSAVYATLREESPSGVASSRLGKMTRFSQYL